MKNLLMYPHNIVPLPQKTCTITHHFVGESVAGTPALPTSKPASPQISYTVAAYNSGDGTGNLPSFSGDLFDSTSYSGGLLAGVLNGSASARTLNWQVNKNGVDITGTGTNGSVTGSQRGVLNFFKLVGDNAPVVGDVFDIYLWCTESNTDLTLQKKAICITPSRPRVYNDSARLLAHSSSVFVNTTVPSGFTGNFANQNTTLKRGTDGSTTGSNAGAGIYGGTFKYTVDIEDSTYGLFYANYVATPYSAVRSHASNYLIDAISICTSFSWKETLKRIV